jgi:PAS domain S-box-containing protein
MTEDPMHRLLFVSSNMPEPGAIATAIARSRISEDWQVSYACDIIRPVMDGVDGLIQQAGYTPPDDLPEHPGDLRTVPFDAVVTFCESSVNLCPTFSGLPARFHWPLDDLVDCGGTPTPRCVQELMEQLDERITSLIAHGSLDVVTQLRETFGSLIDHLTDGVMSIDPEGRIFVFNRAAEEITGYRAGDVIGQVCSEQFPSLDRELPDENDGSAELGELKPVKFVARDGQMLDLELSSVTIRMPDRRSAGALIVFRDQTEVNRLRRNLAGTRGFHGIVGRSEAMIHVFRSIDELASESVPVLIEGESGTGKELVAEALHTLSRRRDKPFVPVNTGALPETIIESELFGHVRGAFTGAVRDKKGRFELAEGGTLFLDEIGEISIAMQVKLLRVLQEKRITPVGGETDIHVDVRIVAATNRDLKRMVERGTFREDLYYRLAVVPIHLPPLRERSGDIPLLVEHVMEQYAGETGRRAAGITDGALEVLIGHPWPGNVRQLANAVQYALIKCRGGALDIQHLPPEILAAAPQQKPKTAGRPPKLDPAEVEAALERNSGNRARAARDLGVARSTLYRYLEELDTD